MFFKNRRESPEADFSHWYQREEPPNAVLKKQLDDALDAVAAFLRIWGRLPLPLEAVDGHTFKLDCEAWASHLLVGAPCPGAADRGNEPGAPREWERVRRFVGERREGEQQAVAAALGDLRQVIWGFVDHLGGLIENEAATDAQILKQLDQLRGAAALPSLEEMKREVMNAVASLAALVERSHAEQRSRIEDLGRRMSLLTGELQEVRRENRLDRLTRLYNRAVLDDALARAASLQQVFAQPSTLLIVDVDHFKSVNDTYGHLVGDQLLVALADCLVRTFPRRNDCVTRFGGDEFAIILSDTTLADAARLAERLMSAIRELAVEHRGERVGITVSIGLTDVAPAESATTWTERADRALYQAKLAGRNRAVQLAAPGWSPRPSGPVEAMPIGAATSSAA